MKKRRNSRRGVAFCNGGKGRELLRNKKGDSQ